MMAPRNQPEDNLPSTSTNAGNANVDAEDIEEIEAVHQSLDSLNTALDMIEAKTDGIKARLLELLNSNKEIRESMIAEKAQNTETAN